MPGAGLEPARWPDDAHRSKPGKCERPEQTSQQVSIQNPLLTLSARK